MNDPKTETKVGRVAPRAPLPENVESSVTLARLPGEGSAQDTPESPEVKEAAAAQARRAKQDALDEAALIAAQIRNSADMLGHFAIQGHDGPLREHYSIYAERVAKLNAILKQQVKDLPAIKL